MYGLVHTKHKLELNSEQIEEATSRKKLVLSVGWLLRVGSSGLALNRRKRPNSLRNCVPSTDWFLQKLIVILFAQRFGSCSRRKKSTSCGCFKNWAAASRGSYRYPEIAASVTSFENYILAGRWHPSRHTTLSPPSFQPFLLLGQAQKDNQQVYAPILHTSMEIASCMFWKWCVRRWSWPALGYYLDIFSKDWRNPRKSGMT
jgi:hypothetical protein